MPKRKRSYARRRRSSKRRRRRKRWAIGKKIRPVFPFAIVRTFNYYAHFDLDPLETGVAGRHYRLNSCFDPDITGTGHQPYGWDQLSKLYERYEVLGSQIRAVFVPRPEVTDASSQGSMQCGIWYSHDNIPTVDDAVIDAQIESRNSIVHRIFNHNDRPFSLKYNWTKKNVRYKSVGVAATGAQDATVPGVGENPAEAHTGIVWCRSADADNTSNPNPVTVHVYITYKVKLTQPVSQPQS